MGIRLITRADDAGSNASADDAILQTCDRGIVRNVSLMANGRTIASFAERCSHRKDICFGVHLTLNAEWDRVRWKPVSPESAVPSLLDEAGFLYATPDRMRQFGADPEEVFMEMQAQLDKLRSLGFHVSYADEHMGFGRVVEGFAERFDAWCRREGLVNHRHFLQKIPYSTSRLTTEDEVIGMLKEAGEGTHLFVSHPALDTPEMRELGHEGYEGDQVAETRQNDFEIMTGPTLTEYIRRAGIELIRYDEA